MSVIEFVAAVLPPWQALAVIGVACVLLAVVVLTGHRTDPGQPEEE